MLQAGQEKQAWQKSNTEHQMHPTVIFEGDKNSISGLNSD